MTSKVTTALFAAAGISIFACGTLVATAGGYLMFRDTPASRYQDAVDLAADGQIEESIAVFVEVETRWPDSEEGKWASGSCRGVLVQTANSRWKAEDYDVAILAAGHVLDLLDVNSDDSPVFSNLPGLTEAAYLGYSQLRVAPENMKFAMMAAGTESQAPTEVRVKAQTFLCDHRTELPWLTTLSRLNPDVGELGLDEAQSRWKEAKDAELTATSMIGWCGPDFDAELKRLTVENVTLGDLRQHAELLLIEERRREIRQIRDILVPIMESCEERKAAATEIFMSGGYSESTARDVWAFELDGIPAAVAMEIGPYILKGREPVTQATTLLRDWVRRDADLLGDECESALLSAISQAQSNCFNGGAKGTKWLGTAGDAECFPPTDAASGTNGRIFSRVADGTEAEGAIASDAIPLVGWWQVATKTPFQGDYPFLALGRGFGSVVCTVPVTLDERGVASPGLPEDCPEEFVYYAQAAIGGYTYTPFKDGTGRIIPVRFVQHVAFDPGVRTSY